MPAIQNNLLTLKEIHIRTELWRDKIYHLANNPYKFPKNDGSGDFVPLPKRFAEIIAEFHNEIDKQKAAERTEEEINQAKQRIGEIRKELKEWIETIIVTYGELSEEEQEQIKVLNQALRFITLRQWKKWVKDTWPEEETVIENEPAAVQFPSAQSVPIDGEEPEPQEKELNQKIEVREKIAPQAIKELVQEWEEQNKIALDRKNICFILQDNQDSLIFCYQPPKGIFPPLIDFLWYRNNIWYETTNWVRINHENAIITAKRSVFLSYYHYFLAQGANGVIHNSPKFGNKDEICQCPAFLESTEYVEFNSDWQPEYKLFKLKNFMGGVWQTALHNKPYGQNKSYPVFHTLDLEEVNGMESQGLYPTTYFLLPDWYQNGHMTSWKKFPIKFGSSKNKEGIILKLKEWIKKAKMERLGHDGQGGKYEHLLKHVHVNYFWNSKKIHESNLDEMDWNNFNVIVRANPAGIMYKFESKKVLFRYSEDLNFTLEADKMQALALKMGTKLLDGLIKAKSGGAVDPKTSEATDDIKDTTNKYLHSGKTEKSKDERQGERKKTLSAGSSGILQASMGAIPSILDASHTHGNYSLGEIALRFDSINFWMRLEFNKNACHRYQMMKVLKKNGNEIFNTRKFGNILQKGYWKIVANIFEGDKNGYFAALFSKGVYVYEEHPHEYFLAKGEKGEFVRGVLNKDPVMTNTTIQINHKRAVGRDNLVHVDNMSWIWKDSYLRPVGSSGRGLFDDLINKGRRHLKRDDANAWKFDGYAQWSDSVVLPKDVKYEWYLHAFSSGQHDSANFRGVDNDITVILTQDGADWSLEILGKVEITETIGNPDAIGSGIEIDEVEEQLPDMEDEKQTEGLENLEQIMQPEAEQQNQQDKELQDELEQQNEPEAQKQDEKQDELEQEDEKNKDKQRQKQKQKEQQQENEQQQQPENSRENEK